MCVSVPLFFLQAPTDAWIVVAGLLRPLRFVRVFVLVGCNKNRHQKQRRVPSRRCQMGANKNFVIVGSSGLQWAPVVAKVSLALAFVLDTPVVRGPLHHCPCL